MDHSRYFLVFLFIFFLTLLAVDIKTFFLPFAFAFCLFFFYFKSTLFESAFLTFILALPFENSIREWVYQVASPLFSDVVLSGYHFIFSLTVKLIFGLLLFLLLLIPQNRPLFASLRFPWPLRFAALFFLLAVVGSPFSLRSDLVFVGLIRLWLSLLFLFAGFVYFSQKHQKTIIVWYLLSLTIFSTTLGLLQLANQKPLGRFLELTPNFSLLGYSTTDGQKQYRVSGFISHPVYFGSFLSILVPITIAYLWQLTSFQTKSLQFYLLLILLSLVVLFGTLSRSGWINIFFIFLVFYLYQKHHPLPFLHHRQLTINPKYLFALLPVVIFAVYLFASRLGSISSLFSYYGNGSIRLELIRQSFTMVSRHPFFGVGLNNFTFELITQNIPSNLYGFIVPVHHTLMLFFAELGIPAALTFILLVFFSFWSHRHFFKLDPLTFGCLIGAFTFLVSSQFHPLFNLDPTFDLFMLILGFLNTCPPTAA